MKERKKKLTRQEKLAIRDDLCEQSFQYYVCKLADEFTDILCDLVLANGTGDAVKAATDFSRKVAEVDADAKKDLNPHIKRAVHSKYQSVRAANEELLFRLYGIRLAQVNNIDFKVEATFWKTLAKSMNVTNILKILDLKEDTMKDIKNENEIEIVSQDQQDQQDQDQQDQQDQDQQDQQKPKPNPIIKAKQNIFIRIIKAPFNWLGSLLGFTVKWTVKEPLKLAMNLVWHWPLKLTMNLVWHWPARIIKSKFVNDRIDAVVSSNEVTGTKNWKDIKDDPMKFFHLENLLDPHSNGENIEKCSEEIIAEATPVVGGLLSAFTGISVTAVAVVKLYVTSMVNSVGVLINFTCYLLSFIPMGHGKEETEEVKNN